MPLGSRHTAEGKNLYHKRFNLWAIQKPNVVAIRVLTSFADAVEQNWSNDVCVDILGDDAAVAKSKTY